MSKNHVQTAIKNGERGFTQIPNDILRDPRLTHSEYRLLLVLLSFGDRVYPNQATLCEYTGMDPATVQKCLYGESDSAYKARVKAAEKRGKPAPERDTTGGLIGLGAVKAHERKGSSLEYELLHHSAWKKGVRQDREEKGKAIKNASAKRQKDRRARLHEKLKAEVRKEVEDEMRARSDAADAIDAKWEAKQQAKSDDEWENKEMFREDEPA